MIDILSEILSGWKNYIFPNPASEALAEKRARICITCEWRTLKSNKCKLCGCPIGKAIRSTPKRCPINKW